MALTSVYPECESRVGLTVTRPILARRTYSAFATITSEFFGAEAVRSASFVKKFATSAGIFMVWGSSSGGFFSYPELLDRAMMDSIAGEIIPCRRSVGSPAEEFFSKEKHGRG